MNTTRIPFPILLLVACNDSHSKTCTLEFLSSTGYVKVVDSVTGQQICQATVVATLGTRSKPLSPAIGAAGCYFTGFDDNDEHETSTWTITAQAPFHASGSVAVEIPYDCHIGPVSVSIPLGPSGGAGGGPGAAGTGGSAGAGGVGAPPAGTGGMCASPAACVGCSVSKPESCLVQGLCGGPAVCPGTCAPYGGTCPAKGFLCAQGADPTWLEQPGCAMVNAPAGSTAVTLWCCP